MRFQVPINSTFSQKAVFLDVEWEEPMLIILLMQEYPYFMHYEK